MLKGGFSQELNRHLRVAFPQNSIINDSQQESGGFAGASLFCGVGGNVLKIKIQGRREQGEYEMGSYLRIILALQGPISHSPVSLTVYIHLINNMKIGGKSVG